MTSIMEWLSNNLPLITAILITIACAFYVGVTLYVDRKRHKKYKHKNYGKHYLYNFLKEHGYTVPMEKEMIYRECCGIEYLRCEIIEVDEILETKKLITIDCSHAAESIRITHSVSEVTKEVGGDAIKKFEVEYSKYVNGVLRERGISGVL